MAIGLYIHVPFCIRKCLYCDFTSYLLKQEQVALYIKALKGEIILYGQLLAPEHKTIASIFVGGGTPTCLMSRQLADILDQVARYFTIQPGAEITTEANPGTVSLNSLKELKRVGFNRLSLGVQSTHQELLNLIGRIHNLDQARQAVDFARQAGFNNLNLDLIFGLPRQTAAQWRQSLSQVLAWQPEHLSCYGLQLEESTPLARAVERGDLPACPEELELAMYLTTIEVLAEAGYRHYEISNFAKPGYECRHNLIYWHNQQYLGLGPAAHSYINNARWANVDHIDKYARLVAQGMQPVEECHRLTPREQMEETAFLGLRLMKGLELKSFAQRFGRELTEVFGDRIKDLQAQGLVELKDGFLRLTKKGLPVANRVFAAFV
ncbi:radical SAM family heme chaperone HemW [Desulfotomaculum nigrificans]|uniref:radical SAM family heme chaperone HemW n=1 Tax=Desulfotomaculum nigrificans TaxID=1565 RepID=UPI0001FAEEFC|nr:radical SAM family heme chaperone HemW [Desulfotomaculum nigrificans]